jgi:hypothetical protein
MTSDPTIDNPFVLAMYQKNMKGQFRSLFHREPTDQKELVAFCMAVFFLDGNSPGNALLQQITGYCASILKLWISPEEEATLKASQVLEYLIEAIAQILILGALKEAESAAEDKRIQGELDAENVEKLKAQLEEMLINGKSN